MKVRFNCFSHFEDLKRGSLYFEDPFRAGFERPLVCRYELHRAGAAILGPDPAYSGPAAYHALLPLDREADLPANEWLRFESLDESQLELAGLHQLHYHQGLAYNIAFAAGASSVQPRQAFCLGLAPGDLSFLENVEPGIAARRLFMHSAQPGIDPDLASASGAGSDQRSVTSFASSAQRFWAGLAASLPGWSDFGPWGNPFRLEGLKLIGLEIIHRFAGERPTLILHDTSGELVFALLLASENFRQIHQGQIPYRLVLVQNKPYDWICRHFEGGTGDAGPFEADANNRHLIPPQPIADLIAEGLRTHLGTAVALEPGQGGETGAILLAALQRLSRAMFVDDEDQVVLILGDGR